MNTILINVLFVLVIALASVNVWTFAYLYRSYRKMVEDARETTLILHMELFRVMIDVEFPMIVDTAKEAEKFRSWRYN